MESNFVELPVAEQIRVWTDRQYAAETYGGNSIAGLLPLLCFKPMSFQQHSTRVRLTKALQHQHLDVCANACIGQLGL